MEVVLTVVLWTIFALVILIALVLDMLGLFGNWLILGAIGVVAVVTEFEHFGVWSLAALLGLAVLGEVVETAASGYGAAKFGGGRGAVVASLVGCLLGAILGTPFLPIIGTLLGAMLGAFVAATLYEFLKMERKLDEAARVGFGAAVGKVAGLMGKTFVGLTMLLVAALTY